MRNHLLIRNQMGYFRRRLRKRRVKVTAMKMMMRSPRLQMIATKMKALMRIAKKNIKKGRANQIKIIRRVQTSIKDLVMEEKMQEKQL